MAEPGALGQVYEVNKKRWKPVDALSNQGAVPTNTWIIGMQRQVRAIDSRHAMPPSIHVLRFGRR